jgi:predicted amidohydrolase YtcJ
MWVKRIFYHLSSIISLLFLCSCSNKQNVSLIIHHAKIYTVDSNFSIAEAMAIQNDKIIAIGKNEAILNKYQASQNIDAKEGVIFPGFIDAHCHFTGYATDQWKCDIMGTTSFEAVIEKMVAYSKTASTKWLYGRGWDQNDWAIKEFPSKEKLDELFPTTPVFLKRVDGHAVLVNQAALNIAGITAATTVKGGSVELHNGKPTGILLDNAMDLVEEKIPVLPDSLAKKYINQMQQTCFAQGLTGVHDCGISEHTVAILNALQNEGNLKMKIYAFLSDSIQYYDKWIKKGVYKNGQLQVGGFKLYADGALGSRGACLLENYSDKKNWKGFLLKDINYYQQIVNKVAGSTVQLCTHAIGDSGNRIMLQLYAQALKNKNGRRWRIEHAQVINENDFHFFGDFNIVPSVQPTHATSDMYWAEGRLGADRIKNAYAYQKLLQQNNWLPLGTDFPVEDISPFKTFFAAVARQDSKGFPANGFEISNALTRQQALRGITIWAAKASFEEKEKGSLEPGKKADFIFLDSDIMVCEIRDVLNAKVLATYINGKKVWGN